MIWARKAPRRYRARELRKRGKSEFLSFPTCRRAIQSHLWADQSVKQALGDRQLVTELAQPPQR